MGKMAKETGKGSNSYKLDETKREKPAKKPKAKASADTGPVSKPNTATAKTKTENVKKAKKSVKSRVAEADKPKKTPTKKIGKKSCSCCPSEELQEKLTENISQLTL